MIKYFLGRDFMDSFQRLSLLIGEENLNKLKNTTILILGLGGVGSYATEALARCGVGKLILVDNDVVDKTNINRQLIALHSTIGLEKTEVTEQRIKDINPFCEVITYNEFITPENLENLFQEKIDYIIDAIDYLPTKKEIIRYCTKNNIPFISSMGTGNKLDPSKLCITELSKTSYDPIARILRKMVKEEKINKKIIVVCSTEISLKKIENVIPSISFVPSYAGLLCASYIVRKIIGEYHG